MLFDCLKPKLSDEIESFFQGLLGHKPDEFADITHFVRDKAVEDVRELAIKNNPSIEEPLASVISDMYYKLISTAAYNYVRRIVEQEIKLEELR